ncbi:MAG: peptide chain release factor 1 [Puniceicoccales bacterium]|jgi:peptide chain release factor 1|nr:peptide chain release factor 1 [Puniceicoccales bacterium]
MVNIPDIGPFRRRHELLEQTMAGVNFFSDQRQAAQVSQEHQKLSLLFEKYERYVSLKENIQEYQNLLDDPEEDAELKVLAKEEWARAEEHKTQLEQSILLDMIPQEASDSRHTIMEIRAGTGGDEASLFVGDLFRMYARYAERRGWELEVLSSSPSECGGFKEIIFSIRGEAVYRYLKLESGVHRVQRIPTTEANGRIHTSAATVAVLPEAEEVDVQIAPEDIEISVCRASGPGGQGVNTTDSAVQILHRPTGMIVYCADERSQQKNRVKAMMVLRSRLLQKKEEEERAQYAAVRKHQVGSGDRSERIRTYNFPQNRLTDHRIGLTLYSLPQIMDGDLEALLDALLLADQEAKIRTLMEETVPSS